MKFNKLSKAEAAALIAGIDNLSDSEFASLQETWSHHVVDGVPPEYQDLLSAIVHAFEDGAGDDYTIDLNVGFALYSYLSFDKPYFGFTNSVANDDDFWRYLTCRIIPDLTYARYPDPKAGDVRINKKRFYAHTRRIWPKTLWWYIHLSWQGDEKSTRAVLRGLGVDTISQLIERTGKGYRLPLYRELMRSYSTLPGKSSALFKRIQKQNTVDCKTIEPALMRDGERGYVQYMFIQLDCQGD